MNDVSNKSLVATSGSGSQEDRLVTISQLAEMEGKGVDSVRRRLKDWGIEPTVTASGGGGAGSTPAQYSLKAIQAKSKEEEEERFLQKAEESAKRIVAKAPEATTQAIVRQQLEAIPEDDTKTILGVAAMMIQKLYLAVEKLDEKTSAQEERILTLEGEKLELQTRLDVHENRMTIARFMSERRIGIPFTREECAEVTRYLHKMGHKDLGKAQSKFDQYPATVWPTDLLDQVITKGKK
jgi:hypothetical protein